MDACLFPRFFYLKKTLIINRFYLQNPLKQTEGVMTKVKEIEEAVANLPEDELSLFRTWFAEFDASIWDEQFERDAESGKLDSLADEALAAFKKGECKEL